MCQLGGIMCAKQLLITGCDSIEATRFHQCVDQDGDILIKVQLAK
jgi:hypothetical protein